MRLESEPLSVRLKMIQLKDLDILGIAESHLRVGQSISEPSYMIFNN